MYIYDACRLVDSFPCRCVSQLQQERGGVTADQQSTDALGEKNPGTKSSHQSLGIGKATAILVVEEHKRSR